MKTKLAILALTVLAGAGATQVLAGPDWLYYPHAVAPKVTPPIKAAAKSCCENRTVVTPPSSGKGVNVSQQMQCKAPPVGKHCDAMGHKH